MSFASLQPRRGPVPPLLILSLLVFSLFVKNRVDAATGGDAVIDPGATGQLITHWGYDIKQGGKAAGLTPSYANTLFVTDKMNLLRLPIWGEDNRPAHPAPGVVISSYYDDILSAMTNARVARPDVVLFASKKLNGQTSFPGWVKETNGVDVAIIPDQYAIMLADFLEHMEANGFVIDVLGIDNETEYNEGDITAQRHYDTITELRTLSTNRGFTMPALLIGPETFGPKVAWMDDLVGNGWGDTVDVVGTHYYPQFRPYTKLSDLMAAGAPRPGWHSELHWDNGGDVIDAGEKALAAIFDCTDLGLSGYAWWSYTRSGVKGGIEVGITRSLAGTRPVFMDDVDGTDTMTYGKLITRAYATETNLVVWALNNGTSNRTDYGFFLQRGVLAGNVSYEQWTSSGSTMGTATLAGSTGFRLTLPAGTITQFEMPISLGGPVAVWSLDETNGTVATDVSAHGHDGDLMNGPVWSNDGSRQFLHFDGVDQYVRVPGLPNLTGSVTVACWARSDTANWNDNGMLVSRRSQFVLHPNIGNKVISFNVWDSGAVVRKATFDLASLGGYALTDWHHYAGTFDTVTGEALLYIDGVERASTNIGPTSLNSNTGVLTIGRDDGFARYFDGGMDDVRLYDRALSAVEIAVMAGQVANQLTWDPAQNGSTSGGAGTWDMTTANWWNGASNVSWVNGLDAIFDGGGGTVTIASNTAVTVGHLTLQAGIGKYSLKAEVDNQGMSVTPGVAWVLSGNELEFVGNQNNDTTLSMTGVGTLTVTGSGTFDTGEKPNGATWGVSGSTLYIQDTLTVRGNVASVGQFGTVKMAGGTTFIHERNSDQTYANDWELDGGLVTFDNRWARNYNLDGTISGTGGMQVQSLQGKVLRLRNATNTHVGRTVIGSGGHLVVTTGNEQSLGANPASLVTDQLELNGGIFQVDTAALVIDDSNRGIEIGAGGGTFIANSDLTLSAPVSGAGDLIAGGGDIYAAGVGSAHTGITAVDQGVLLLGANNGLSVDTIVDVLNDGTGGRFDLNGFDQTIAGLRDTGAGGGGVKQMQNSAAGISTLTLHVPLGQSHSFSRNIQDNIGGGSINLVKTGAGTQFLNRTEGAYSGLTGTIRVEGGLLQTGGNGLSTATFSLNINSNGTLLAAANIGSPVTVNPGGRLSPGPSIVNLAINSQLTLGGEVEMEISNNPVLSNDRVFAITSVSYGGTLIVTNVGGAPLQVGDQWALFLAAAKSGDFAEIIPATPGAGLEWSFNPASGLLKVVSAGPVTNPPPALTNMVAGGSYEFSWGSEYTGFTLQSQTNALNVGLDVNGWTDIPGTESVNTYTQAIELANPSVFFRLVYTNTP